MVDLYKKIETLCKENRTNITAMCSKAGVGRSTLTELKQGRTKELSLSNINKIANYFGISADYFLDKTDNPSPNSEPQDETDELINKLKDYAGSFSGGAPNGLTENELAMLKVAIQIIEDKKQENKR